MTTDEISKRSLRTLCERSMQKSGEYVQVSIFSKTILDLLDELATGNKLCAALTDRLNDSESTIATLKARESAARKVLEAVRYDTSGREHFRYCRTGVKYPGLSAPQDDRCSICEKIDSLIAPTAEEETK